MRKLLGYKIKNDHLGKGRELNQLYSPQDKNIAQVPGNILEVLLQLENDTYLLFLTDDSPYEECLYVLLLDHQYRILDRVDLYQEYICGIFSDLRVLGTYELSFTFLENQKFHLKIEIPPKFKLQRFFDLDPIHYPNQSQKTYITIGLHT